MRTTLTLTAILLLTACSSADRVVPGHSIRIELDISDEWETFTLSTTKESIDLPRMSSPRLRITGSPEDVRDLSIGFNRFGVYLGDPVDGVQQAKQQGWEGALELPWEIRLDLNKITWPLKVRLVGLIKGDVGVVIKERVFEGVE